ncbi:ROK family transcriptional regulator [Gellertiella hungarica]|uniref:Putative NBD/HSP70 family sugar kinase n=1 Tax=Gellertiella hungarica TaxID=1572859 RepID=A0A7W6J779_9HYPH|nr:ROK family transcriptional regulator [Gellertiella hungarica]MBB4066090.1 putative NBD/HSP70 family sugar kinase [Gellertiella hungarica]
MKPVSGTNLEQARAHNRRVVIEAIRVHGPLSRAELARLSALTVQTVSNIVEDLVAARLLKAEEPRRLPRGQPITPYSLNPDGAYSIGLELERDHAGGVLTDLSGAIRARARRPALRPGPDEAIPLMAGLVEEMIERAGIDPQRLLGAGLAMAGRYQGEGVTSLSPVALPGWAGFPVATALSGRIGLPVLVENDASAAAIGERLHGVARGLGSFVYLWLGGGIGAGLVLDGQLYRGSRRNAGEIGHMTVVPGGKPCPCGKRGCLDRYVSLGAVHAHLGIGDPLSLDPAELDRRLEAGGEGIEAWLDEAVGPMRQVIDTFELAFDPETVVIGGAMPPGLLKRLAERLEPLPPPLDPKAERALPRVILGATGKDTAILGAAALPVFSQTNPQFDVLQKRAR